MRHPVPFVSRRLIWPFLFVPLVAGSHIALAEETVEIVPGKWEYFTSVLAPPGYVADPAEACALSAANHLFSDLVSMYPRSSSTPMYDCVYRHFGFKRYIESFGTTELRCPTGYRPTWPGVCLRRREIPRPPSCSPGDAAYALGNPVIVSSGAKVQREVDMPAAGAGALEIVRTYRTMRQTGAHQSGGQGWSFSFERGLEMELPNNAGAPFSVLGVMGDGSQSDFKRKANGEYQSLHDNRETLTVVGAGFDEWVYTAVDGQVDHFKKHGDKFLLMSSRKAGGGAAAFYAYDANGRVQTITDAHGRTLTVLWNAFHVAAIEGASGKVSYQYETAGYAAGLDLPGMSRLASVEFYDANGKMVGSKRYHYDERNQYLLTGITDENGIRFATFAYDASGQAVLSEHAGGVDRYQFAYPSDGARVVTDPLGTRRSIAIAYAGTNAPGHVSGESQPAGAGCSPSAKAMAYDGEGNLKLSTDFNNKKTCFYRDPVRGVEIARVTGLAGSDACPVSETAAVASPLRKVSTRWHPYSRLVAGRASALQITSYLYNGQKDPRGVIADCAAGAVLPNGRPIPVICRTTIQPTGDTNGTQGFFARAVGRPRIWNFTYNDAGSLLTRVGPADANGNVESMTNTYYDSTTSDHTAGDLASSTNGAGERTQYLEYAKDGLITRLKRTGGQTVSIDYGARQRVVAVTVSDSTGGSERTGYAYDDVGQLTQSTAPDGAVTFYSYDDAHRLASISDALGNSLRFRRDGMGNVIKQEVTDAKGAIVQQKIAAFDALNRLAKTQRDLQDAGSTYEYDAGGNLTKSTDALGRATEQRYDAFNRLSTVALPAAAPGAERPQISYAYNHQDHVVSIMDPRKLITSYTLDAFGDQVTLQSPDTGKTKTDLDNAGKVQSIVDARSRFTTFRFDQAGRLVKRGASAYEFGKDGTPSAGLLAKIIDESGESAYAHDGFGRIREKAVTIGAGSSARRFHVGYTVGNQGAGTGRLTTLTYPSGNRIELSYGPDGKVTRMTLAPARGGQVVPLLIDVRYAPFGGVQSWTWGNGKPYSRAFDLDGRLTEYPLGHQGAGGGTRILAYDQTGRITAMTHTGTPSAFKLNQRFAYDDLDRLTGFDASYTSQQFTYDLNGNRTGAYFGATSYVNTISPTSNWLTSTTGPAPAKVNTYDAAGNIINDGTIKYTYGSNGRMTRATIGRLSTTYVYNGLGQRVSKAGAAGAVHYVYDEEGQLLGEYDGAGKAIQETVYLEGMPVAVLNSANTEIYYVHSDHIATPRVVTRATDNMIVWRWDSADPFGLAHPDENPSAAGPFVYNLRFPGQLFDRESNNHYNYFRDYDPSTGRYVQSDPIGVEGGLNTYGYVGANPHSGIDPYGLKIDAIGTPAERKRIRKGLKELAQASKSASRMIDFLTKSSRVFTIEIGCEGDHYGADKEGNPKEGNITWNPNKTHNRDGSEDWHYRPSFIGLGHELIHAYAEANGMRPLGNSGRDQAAYDEYGTVGIPRPSGKPTASYPYTENIFRQECGCAKRRQDY